MILKSVELSNFRNYESLQIQFEKGTNILYGDNAQGKTNVLESIYVSGTTKSHKSSKDKEMIQFGQEESHIRTIVEKKELDYQIDIHIKKNRSKGIAINKIPIKKASELFGILNIVFFSPEDLNIIKNGPSERRRFMDLELCQLDKVYLYYLVKYNKVLAQRNKLLKDAGFRPDLLDTLPIWNTQLLEYGKKIISARLDFVKQLNEIIYDIHKKITGEKEVLILRYEPDTKSEEFEAKLEYYRERELRLGQTLAGPHRDDLAFYIRNAYTMDMNVPDMNVPDINTTDMNVPDINVRDINIQDIDVRRFGSQGQQKTSALSLKLSEIELVKKSINETPILLLDDVLSELDSSRQNFLLNSIHDIQAIITCTGLDEFVKNRFQINKVFQVMKGQVFLE